MPSSDRTPKAVLTEAVADGSDGISDNSGQQWHSTAERGTGVAPDLRLACPNPASYRFGMTYIRVTGLGAAR